MRRALAAAAALGIACAAQAQDGLTNFGSAPKAEPLSETVFGVPVSDPYRWMEDEKRKPEVDAWLKAASAHTTAQLAALPGYPALLADVTAASRAAARSFLVRETGSKAFFLRIAPDQNQPVLMLREGAAQPRVFLDPGQKALGGFSASADGRYLYAQMSGGGSEVGEARIYDVATGKPLPDVLTPVWGDDAANWIDDQTLTYVRLAATQGPGIQENITTYLHRVGTPISADVPLIGSLATNVGYVVDKTDVGFTSYHQGDRYMLGMASTARADARVAVAPIDSITAGKPQWTPVAEYADRVQGADLHGDTLYLLTTKTNPDGAIVATSAATPDLAQARPVIGGKGMVIRGFVAGPAGLYVNAVKPNGSSALHYVPYAGGAAQEIALPFAGAIEDLKVSADGRSVTAALMGWLHNTDYLRFDGATARSVGIENETVAQLVGGTTLLAETATSADGTKVPLSILVPVAGTRPYPTILETYASYGYVSSPYYSPVMLSWVKRGGVFATCHARGGGDQGRAWHDAGRETNKPNGQADVIACGERLVALGLASPRTLGGWGTSAGGTIIPPAALKRPDLFRAVTASVAMVNPTRLEKAENGAMQFAEFGDPRTETGYKALMAQDSIALLDRAKGGPDFLFTVGLNDHRVPPWNSAKVAAAMQAKWGDRHLALLRTDADAGHGIGSSRDQTIRLRTDMFAFFLNRFGQPGFTVPPAAAKQADGGQ